jgi:predicted amidohydrolase
MAELGVALVHETFADGDGPVRLLARLREARGLGADLAVLPELPLHAWSPATRTARDEDAEVPGGPLQREQAAAAREAGIAVLGGVIVREAASGHRFNRALLFDAGGRVLGGYDKLHVPSEPGFWETDHYDPGREPPRRIDGLALPLGIQICSDFTRPEGCLMLGARGVAAILGPRATPLETYDRWRLVLRADAVTSCAYVVSVNRPGPEAGVGIGGPSLAIAPDGTLLVESTDPVRVVVLDSRAAAAARRDYPGYLPTRSGLYVKGWTEIARERDAPGDDG